jgi:hypothetical protein
MTETQRSGLQNEDRTRGFSRRQILSTIAAAGTYLGLQPLARARASDGTTSSSALQGCSPAPVPIPGGFNGKEAFGPRFPDKFFNFFLPGTGLEPSTIFNFNGVVTIQSIQGTGTRTELDPITGEILSETPNLPFATDVRFMDGIYVGVDGREHPGTFAFF